VPKRCRAYGGRAHGGLGQVGVGEDCCGAGEVERDHRDHQPCCVRGEAARGQVLARSSSGRRGPARWLHVRSAATVGSVSSSVVVKERWMHQVPNSVLALGRPGVEVGAPADPQPTGHPVGLRLASGGGEVDRADLGSGDPPADGSSKAASVYSMVSQAFSAIAVIAGLTLGAMRTTTETSAPARTVSDSMRWIPLVTFWQATADLALGFSTPSWPRPQLQVRPRRRLERDPPAPNDWTPQMVHRLRAQPRRE
jgi:hypothetical protein